MASKVQFVQSVVSDWRQHPDEVAFFESLMTNDLQLDWGSKTLAERVPPDADWPTVAGLLICAALCSWRKTMGIYTFDGELFSALQNSDSPDFLPPPPEMAFFLFAGDEVFLVFNIWDHSNPLDNAPTILRQLLEEDGTVPPWLAWRCIPPDERLSIDRPFTIVGVDELRTIARLLAYLATKAPDVEGPARPRQLRRNKHGALVSQNHPAVWQVGLKIGAHIRQQRAEAQGGTVRPHVRRGHFHTYLHGQGRQERVVKWTAPTFVLGGPDRPTIRSVQP